MVSQLKTKRFYDRLSLERTRHGHKKKLVVLEWSCFVACGFLLVFFVRLFCFLFCWCSKAANATRIVTMSAAVVSLIFCLVWRACSFSLFGFVVWCFVFDVVCAVCCFCFLFVLFVLFVLSVLVLFAFFVFFVLFVCLFVSFYAQYLILDLQFLPLS